LCITFEASRGQDCLTTTLSNKNSADVSTQHTCNISGTVTLDSEM